MTTKTTTTALKNEAKNEKIKDIAFIALIGIALSSYLLPTNVAPAGTFDFLPGLVLIGMNLYRYANGIRMSKFTFMLGAFFFNSALLADAYLMNGLYFPLFGLMVAAWAIFNALDRRQQQGAR